MSKAWIFGGVGIVAAALAGGYLVNRSGDPASAGTAPQPPMRTAEAPVMASAGMPAAGVLRGTVVETFDSGGYTYVKADCDGQEVWAATKPQAMSAGDPVEISTAMPMHDFHSPSLDRTFKTIYFVSGVSPGSGADTGQLPPGHPPIDGHGAGAMIAPHGALAPMDVPEDVSAWTHGKVVETMNAGEYTYASILESGADEAYWVAAPGTDLAVGQDVRFPPGQVMPLFESPSLNRAFTNIHFVAALEVAREDNGAPSDVLEDPRAGLLEAEPTDAPTAIAAIVADGPAWQGKDAVVRGSVTKFTPDIMGQNWAHISDAEGSDLVITTHARLALGQKIVAQGRIAADKDIGAGYVYSVLLEDAAVYIVE